MYLWISKKVLVCPEVNVKCKIHIPVHDSWKYMYFPKTWQELKSHEVIMLEFWITAFPSWSDNKRIDRRTQSWCETAIPLLNYNHGKISLIWDQQKWTLLYTKPLSKQGLNPWLKQPKFFLATVMLIGRVVFPSWIICFKLFWKKLSTGGNHPQWR